MARTQLRIWQDAVRGRKGRERIRRRAAFNQHRRSMTMPATHRFPPATKRFTGEAICPEHGVRPFMQGLPDHAGFSGWGEIQTELGDFIPCIRCGDCGRALLVSTPEGGGA